MLVDARGQSCPIPVIMVQNEIKAHKPESLEVLVDNACSLENVTRYGTNAGYHVTSSQEGNDYRLVLTK